MENSSYIKKIQYIEKKIGKLMFFIGIILIIYLIKKVGLNNLWGSFLALTIGYTMLSVIMSIINLVIASYRFSRFIKHDLHYLEFFQLFLYGNLINYGAGVQGLGIGLKAGLLKTKNIGFTKSAAGITSEIVYDILVTLIISFLYLLISPLIIDKNIVKFPNFSFLLLIVGVVFLITVSLLYKKNEIIHYYITLVKKSFYTIGFFFNFILTFLIWLSTGISIMFLFKGLQINLPITLAVFGSTISYLLSLATFIPGGLGVRDISRANIYTFASISFTNTAAIVLISRFLHIVTIVLIIVLILLYKKFFRFSANLEHKR